MGLDMSLYRVKKGENPNLEATEVSEAVYWRKANAIRQWFVDHTDYPVDGNCKWHLVGKADLVVLINDCAYCLTAKDSKMVVERIMPTSDGFFFGDTNYDDWYFDQLLSTITQVAKLLREVDFEKEDIYYYEWW